MSSTSAWKLRRLAPRAIRVQTRRAGDAPVLAVFAQTLPIKANAFIAAYDAAYVALAAKHDLTPVQLALGFVRSRWFVSSTIIGASSLAQLQETLPATQTPMSPELLAEIDAIHLRYTNPAP